ncbi:MULTISPECIES: CehA/McbA family metallohydrolase [unclassified Yoonia]|uniref:CehA/McbA family metallohydrolase n=1 Tax=unclassified Yoonia TaxID=2629118 RepID=UPI002AFE5341|nr:MULTISPECIES: CehA/McbA family metallohydrolase [unclassified Yoonia]
MTNPFDLPGRFWRGNLHTHSTNSDGVLAPQEVCRRYQAEGYDFIALTDHFIGHFNYPISDTRPYRNDAFTTILGAELHSGAMQNGELWHILAVGLPADFTPPDAPDFSAHPGQETGPALARRARDAGAFVAIAHPEWSQLSLEDAAAMEAAHAVEIYNHGCVTGCDRGSGVYVLEHLLNAGRRVTLCATDDAHFSEPDHFGGWVMVRAPENTPEALLAALKDGAFYSSTGPEIHHVTWGDDAVEIHCGAAVTAVLQGQGSRTSVVHGHSLTRITLPYKGLAASPWLRLTIIDAGGKRAWTNPFWRDS